MPLAGTAASKASQASDTAPPVRLTLLKLAPDSAARRERLDVIMMGLEILAGLAILLLLAPRFEGDIVLFVALVALNMAAERAPISIYGESKITVGFVFTLPIMAFFGPAGAAIVAPLEAAARSYGSKPLNVRFFRGAFRYVAVYAGAATVFGLFSPTGAFDLRWQIVPGALAASAFTFGASALLITTAVSLRDGDRWAQVWADHRWVAPHYAAFGVVGLGLMASYIGLGYAGILAYLTPAFMLRYTMKQYVDKTAENVEKLREQNKSLQIANIEVRRVSDELKVTYSATLEALVSALEARDQETKGHCVRVARYMLNIAEALGVTRDSREWLDMQHGALLHDVGKIGVRDWNPPQARQANAGGVAGDAASPRDRVQHPPRGEVPAGCGRDHPGPS